MLLTDNTQRLLRIEAKLDAIIKHLNVAFDPVEAVAILVRRGDKIGAIRLHRSLFGSDLAEAKQQVEAMR